MAGNDRYVPTEDLVNIYTELYGQSDIVTSDVIDNCTLLLYLQRSVHFMLSSYSYWLAGGHVTGQFCLFLADFCACAIKMIQNKV